MDLLWPMFYHYVAHGFEANSRDACAWFNLGVGLLVGFVGLLRPGELIGI